MRRVSVFHSVNAILLLLLALVMIYPMINLLAISFTSPKYIAEANGLTIIPKEFTTVNYRVLLSIPKVYRGLFNSLFITITSLFLNLLLTSFAAYVLTRKDLIGRRVFLVLVIIIMIIEGGIIPDYLLLKKLGLLNRYLAVILFKAINVYYLIIMMRFFTSVPTSLIEAAKINGASDFRILFQIVIPVCKAGVATIALFYTVFHWNEYFRAMIYLTDQTKWPLQVVLRELIVSSDKASFLGASGFIRYTESMQIDIKAMKAGMIILGILPILMIYPLVLKFFTKGTLSGAVKE